MAVVLRLKYQAVYQRYRPRIYLMPNHRHGALGYKMPKY